MRVVRVGQSLVVAWVRVHEARAWNAAEHLILLGWDGRARSGRGSVW